MFIAATNRPFFVALVLASTVLLGAIARAEIKVEAEYRLTDPQALGAVQGPAELENERGDRFALERKGEPHYFNIPPNVDDGRALQFDGEHDAYVLAGGLSNPPRYFVLEVWAQATNADAPGLHGVAALGNGARGYSLVQFGRQWGAFIGGRGFVPMGPVAKGRWTHLAMVLGLKGTKLYLDGFDVGAFPPSTGIVPNFSIGNMGGDKEFFAGDVAVVRLSSVGAKGFDPNTDLLIDRAKVEEALKEQLAQRKARIRTILQDITLVDRLNPLRFDGDWLIHSPNIRSTFQVKPADDGRSATMVLANGLVRRTFHLGDNLVCCSLRQEPAGLEFLRSIKPEATIQVAGERYRIGGMIFSSMATGHKGHGRSPFVANYFLDEWLDELVGDPNAFQLVRITIGRPQAWLKWEPMKPKNDRPWPPEGLRVSMHYSAPETAPDVKDLQVIVHYEIYDGIPVIGKWLSFANAGEKPITLDRTLIEELAFADENANKVFVESEYNHFRAVPVRWYVDPELRTDSGPVYTERMSDYRLRYWSQQELDEAPRSYYTPMNGNPEWAGEYRSRSLMQVQYPVGPAKTLGPNESFSTFKSWLLVHDSMDEDRKGMARQALYRSIMPWTQESLAYMHVLRQGSNDFRQAVDQAAACGLDMVILTFGSGYNMMSTDPAYIAGVKADFDYARSKGIKAGGYILFSSSRSYGDGRYDVKPATYGRSLCLGSEFGDEYFEQLIGFMKKTGAEVIETDGPYHGFGCERTDHALHRGMDDSYRVNWEQQSKFYRMCMDEGFYVISPDWYFAAGARKMPMGYRESNWTLPRAQQALVARQNIYDGTWWRTPSMSYHMLPLSSLYGGGPESTLEPLSEHLDTYDAVLAQNFGMGIMAAYRGTRMYDTPETKAVVESWIDFYRRHESVLLSPIVHVRRPDGRDLDCMMHVNAALPEKGLAFVWNPTDRPITRDVELSLYYTGINETARIGIHTGSSETGEAKTYLLDRDRRVRVPLTVPARGYVWLLIEDASPLPSDGAVAPIGWRPCRPVGRGWDVAMKHRTLPTQSPSFSTATTGRECVLRCLEFDHPARVPRHLWTLPIVDVEQGPGTIEAFRRRWPDDVASTRSTANWHSRLGGS